MMKMMNASNTGAVGTGSTARAGAPSFQPLYQQIKHLILQSLQQGEWKPAEIIPSETELAARFGVSQGTVRKAIDELAAEHLLVRRQGRGTFVATHAERHVRYRFLRLIPDSSDSDQAETNPPPKKEIMECRHAPASAEVAQALGLRAGDDVIQARRVLSFGSTPTIMEDLWLPGAAFRDLTAQRLAAYSGSMYAFFESEFGVRMVQADEKIRAVLPNQQQAALLQVSAFTPLLSVERIAFTYGNQPMELRQGLYRTDACHYYNHLS